LKVVVVFDLAVVFGVVILAVVVVFEVFGVVVVLAVVVFGVVDFLVLVVFVVEGHVIGGQKELGPTSTQKVWQTTSVDGCPQYRAVVIQTVPRGHGGGTDPVAMIGVVVGGGGKSDGDPIRH